MYKSFLNFLVRVCYSCLLFRTFYSTLLAGDHSPFRAICHASEAVSAEYECSQLLQQEIMAGYNMIPTTTRILCTSLTVVVEKCVNMGYRSGFGSVATNVWNYFKFSLGSSKVQFSVYFEHFSWFLIVSSIFLIFIPSFGEIYAFLGYVLLLFCVVNYNIPVSTISRLTIFFWIGFSISIFLLFDLYYYKKPFNSSIRAAK